LANPKFFQSEKVYNIGPRQAPCATVVILPANIKKLDCKGLPMTNTWFFDKSYIFTKVMFYNIGPRLAHCVTFVAFPSNIKRLGWKGQPGANILGYLTNRNFFTIVKSFITLAPG
jgi:hypothetical protein